MAFKRDKALEAAQKHRRKGNWDKALREYQKVLAETPQDIRVLQNVAEVYLKLNMAAEALSSYRQIAYHYLQDDHFERASAFFKLAIGLDGNEPQLRRDLGQAYHRMGRLKDALIEFNEAYKTYKATGDSENQRVVLEAMVQLDPEDVPLRVRLAERLVKDGRLPEALDLFEYACARLDEEGRLDEYLQVAERLLHFRREDLEHRRRVVRIHLERSDYKRALGHLQVLFQQDNQHIDTLQQLAFCFEQLGQVDKTVMVLKELARVWRNQGQVERSNEMYRRVLNLDPNDRDARNILAHVQRQQSLEDSGSLPGMDPRTGNMPTRQSTQPTQAAPVEIELLDDDLGDLMGMSSQPTVQPGAQPQPVRAQAPRQQPVQTQSAMHRPRPPAQPQYPTQQAPPRTPVNPRPQPPRPATPTVAGPPASDGFDFAGAFADDFSDLGEDIELGGLQQLPPVQAEPVPDNNLTLEVVPILEPVGDAQAEFEVDKEARASLDEADVFIKYGLPHKARVVLIELVNHRPGLIAAREALCHVYEHMREPVLAADQCVEMASIVRSTPDRAVSYLERAVGLLGDRARVETIARQRNIPFSKEDTTQEDLLELDFLEDSDIGDILDDIALPESVLEEPGDSVYELADDEFDLLADESLHDLSDQGAYSSVEQVNAFDTDNILVDLSEDVSLLDDDIVSLDDVELLNDATDIDMAALPMDALPTPPSSSNAALDAFGLTEGEAESMFDDLFNDFSSANSPTSGVGLQSLSGFGTLSQNDRSDVERVITQEALNNPNARRLTLGTNNMKPANPFGSRSLSRDFDYHSVDEMAAAQTETEQSYNLSMEQTNTQYELGAAYLEMGLYEEALAEFRQALEDPSMADSATLKIAECELRLGRAQHARQRLSSLLQAPGTPESVRQSASQLLAKVPG